jgi:ABC-type Mn2+/Zn2+ transport system ATPase subunit
MGRYASLVTDERAGRTPARKLSTGQPQNLSLCRMLLDQAPLLVIDEPLSGVDRFTIREVIPPLAAVLDNPERTVLTIGRRIAS